MVRLLLASPWPMPLIGSSQSGQRIIVRPESMFQEPSGLVVSARKPLDETPTLPPPSASESRTSRYLVPCSFSFTSSPTARPLYPGSAGTPRGRENPASGSTGNGGAAAIPAAPRPPPERGLSPREASHLAVQRVVAA